MKMHGAWGEERRAEIGRLGEEETERPCEIASRHFVNFTGQAERQCGRKQGVCSCTLAKGRIVFGWKRPARV